MNTIDAFVKADEILRRSPHAVKKFTLKKVGHNYYIFASMHGLAHPTVVGRYADRGQAQIAFDNLEKTIKEIQKKS